MLYVFAWNPNIFPGADFNVTLLIWGVLGTFMFLAYAMIYAAFPRSGADYIFQSRVLHPSIGFASTYAAWFIYSLWFIALEGVTFVQFYLIPFFVTLAHATGNVGYGAIADSLLTPSMMGMLSYAYIIILGLVVMAGPRIYLKIQNVFMILTIIATIALFALLAGTPHEAFVANFNAYMAKDLGTADSYNLVLNTARQAGYDLAPSFNLWSTVGAVMVAWVFAMEWPVYGNLGLGGELKQANLVKTHATTILATYYAVIATLAIIYNLFMRTAGQEFMNAVALLTWNGNAVFSNLPSLFYYAPMGFIIGAGTNNIPLLGVFAIASSLSLASTSMTIFFLTTRMLFAQTFDRLWPTGLAHVSRRTNNPTYITIVMIIVTCIWEYGVLFYPTVLYHYMASTQFQTSFTMMLTMIGALIFRRRLKKIYEQSPTAGYGKPLMLCATIGILANLIVIYYLFAVPGLGALVPDSAALIVGVFIIGIVYYFIVKAYRKAKGLDLGLAFGQIPPD
jgi:amino acid transporter